MRETLLRLKFSRPYDPLRRQYGCKTEVVTLLAFPNCDLHSKNSGNWLKLIGGTRSSHLPLDRKSLLNIISFKSSILLAVEIPTLLGIGYIFFMRSNQTSLSLFHIVVLVDLIHILLAFKLSDIWSFRHTIFIYIFFIFLYLYCCCCCCCRGSNISCCCCYCCELSIWRRCYSCDECCW